MTDIQKRLAELDALIDEKKIELLNEQNEVHVFVGEDHKAKATKEYLGEFRQTAVEINRFNMSLINAKKNADKFKEDFEALCAKGMELNALVRDIRQELVDDLKERRHNEAVDMINVTRVVASLAVTAIVVSKATFDPDSTHVVAEASTGAASGLLVSFYKQTYKGIKGAANALCGVPRKIKRRIAPYNLKERAKEVGKQMLCPVTNEKSFVLVISRPGRGSTRKTDILPPPKV